MSRIVFTNARLLDGDNPARAGVTVVVAGEVIASVASGPHVDPRPDDVIHDLAGKTLMPAMVNGHYHASYTGVGGGNPTPVGMEAPPALQTLRAASHLKKALYAGFTGVVSGGAPYAIDASCKRAIAEGLIEGPRMVAGSRDVSTTGHAQDWWQWHWGPGMAAATNIVDGPENFRRAVREEIKRGSEIIKIFATAGHGIPGNPGLEVAEDELAAACCAAHQRGARVRAHLAGAGPILAAIAAGVDVIDHGDGAGGSSQCIDALLANDRFLVPSMLYPHRVCEVAAGPWIDQMRRDLDGQLAELPALNQAGVKLVLGDDFGAQPLAHGDYADELDFYVNVAGIPALDVIRWATKHGGELMGRGHDIGTIAPGRQADLLIVDGDPLADIALLKSARGGIVAVMKGGGFVRSSLGGAAR